MNRTRVLATVVHLLDTTLIRVGNREYARANKSFGLTTLQDRHVACTGSEIRFKFRGKSGKEWRLKVTDRRIARIVKSCQDLPGQHLFQYEDDDGLVRQVTSADVNAYLREIAGPAVSAKMFRTWNGTVIANAALRVFSCAATESEAKRNIRRAIEIVASRLGNTVSICRKCYVHPAVLEAYLDPARAKSFAARGRARERAGLSEDEADVLALLSASARRVSKRRPRSAKKRV
jgi:DNA topoisomerase-1